jgi:carboxymethylenebutenolidase
MVALTRPEGPQPEDFRPSRRGALGGLFFAGYAAAAVSVEAAPIVTDEAGLITAETTVPQQDVPLPIYLARPARAGRAPVVIVASEVFGVHAYIKDVCRRLAKLGYVAVAPAFFHRAGDPAPLTDFGAIQKIVATASNEQVLGDIGATVAWLRRQPFADARRMGITGFCWGGAVTWMAVHRFPEFRAGVAWYGRLTAPKPDQFLGGDVRPWPVDVAPELRAPVLGLYAGKDAGIPQVDVRLMRAALQASGKVGSNILVYTEAAHGFHADYRGAYDRAAAEDGWSKMLAHFAANGVAPRR